ncbi:MAG: ADP-ribosylglycohydrolase family protein [Chloroflexota bacterium]|nr:ADP-ribosylglycohydrolase family protein [Chloroflexota bacterium]
MYTNETAASNRTILEELFTEGGIRIKRGNLFDWSPGPKPDTFSFDKVEGMLLGVGIGDALGILTEGWLPSLRKQHKGEITDYQKNKYTGEYRGYPSDDSQMTFWTLEQLIADGGYVPANVADAMIKERIIGIGHNVKEYAECRKHGLPWYECGPESAGNGSAMRISPMLIPHLRTGASDLWVDTALSAMTTHNDSFAIASCLALTNMLWQALDMHEPPAAEWWLNTFIDIVRDLENGGSYQSKAPKYSDYSGPGWQFVDMVVRDAYAHDLDTFTACQSWYSGAYMLETIPCVIYILMRHGHNLEEAIIRAVNDTYDNDSVAAIVGAQVGALHGRQALPARWVDSLSGCTIVPPTFDPQNERDDGKMFELIAQARSRFWKD